MNQYGGAVAALVALPGLALLGGREILRIPTRTEAETEIAAAAKIGVRLGALGKAEYPSRLREIDDALPLLAILGNSAVLAELAVTIVGARNASAAGMRFAGELVRGLGAAGFAIVSRLARGIDSAIHRVSIATGTIAVLAGGHDKPYPPEHADLLEQIVATGAAVGKMPVGLEPRTRDFPRRNRLIAGIALGAVIVEAAERSGSLITARLALEQSREVFAVLGSPLDPRTQGTNRLLKQGATLVTSVADVIDVLIPILGQPPPPMSEPDWPEPADQARADDSLRKRVLELLGPTPVAVDDLVHEARIPAGAVQIVLLELELASWIERHGGGLVSLI